MMIKLMGRRVRTSCINYKEYLTDEMIEECSSNYLLTRALKTRRSFCQMLCFRSPASKALKSGPRRSLVEPFYEESCLQLDSRRFEV